MTSEKKIEPLRVGVCGLGRAFMLTLPTLIHDPRIKLVAATDTRDVARRRFESEFACPTFDTVDELAADPSVEAVYVATPHEQHRAHAIAVAARGKGLLLEKPMALNVEDARAIEGAVEAGGAVCVIGPSHSFDEPYAQTARMIKSGEYGEISGIHMRNDTDFMCRPRRPEEWLPSAGGVVMNQAAHQVDIARLLAGEEVVTVEAELISGTGERQVPGAYSVVLTFTSGLKAELEYDGFGHADTASEFDMIGELGHLKSTVRPTVKQTTSRDERSYGALGSVDVSVAAWDEYFGSVLARCERAILAPGPAGVSVIRDGESAQAPGAAPTGLRSNVITELYAAVRDGARPLRDARWGVQTTRICEAILRAGESRQPVELTV